MTPSLLLLAPLRIEQAALRAPAGTRVLRTAMGPEHARIAAARALAIDARAVAVAGVCAGIATGLEPGDVVCATELRRDGEEPIAVPGSAAVANALRAHGLRVHVGPLLSATRLVPPDERAALVSTGALAVDMESAWLAAGSGGRPFAVVRVVADAAGRRLVDPRLLLEGSRALLALRHVAAALADWAEASLPPGVDPSCQTPITVRAPQNGKVPERT